MPDQPAKLTQSQSAQAITPDQLATSQQPTQLEQSRQSIIHPITAQSFAIIDREIGEHNFTTAEYAIVRRVIHTTADFEFKELIKFTPNAIEQGIKAIASGKPIVVDVGMVKQGITGLVGKTFGNQIINALDYMDSRAVDVDLDRNLELEQLTQSNLDNGSELEQNAIDRIANIDWSQGDRHVEANNLNPDIARSGVDAIASEVATNSPISQLAGKEMLNMAQNMTTSIKPQTTRAGMGMYICAKQHPDAIFVVGNAPTALLSLCRLAQSDRSFAPSLIIGVPVGFVAVVEAKAILAKSRLSHICSAGRKGGSPVAAAIINALITLAW
jgi:precorrin isomerase